MVESNHPAFDVRCPNPRCNASPGTVCSRWEGAPAFCVERGNLAREIFGVSRTYTGQDGVAYKI